MKILMVLDHEFPTDVRVENEAIALLNAGHEVHIACYTRKLKASFETYKGIQIHRIAISNIMYKLSVAALTLPFYFLFWKKFLNGLVLDHSIEAVHIHDLPLARVGFWLKKRFGLNLIVDLHENWPALLSVSTHTKTFLGKILSPISLWKRYEKNILKYADHTIVVVDEAMDRLKKLGVNQSKISVVSNTLNKEEFGLPDLNPDSNYFTLYYAGGINFHRGLQTVIEAVAALRAELPQIRFRIAGFGSYEGELKNLVKRLDAEEYIDFLGYLTLKDVAINLSKADVAVIPHLKTDHTDSTIPHKLFQYMYINKPIIASNCAPIQRIVEETKSGVIFQSGSVADLSKKILMLANRELKIEPARHWVEEKYNWSFDSKVLVNSYSNI